MLATKSPGSPAPSRLLGVPATELKFRIQGGEHHGRILRIAGAKCTIGSATGCTLRLRRNDIEPLHCLILSGRNGTVVRRNSPRTYLNGGAFEDALLQAGDVLRIGSLELVVESCPQALPAPMPTPQAYAQTEVFPSQVRPSPSEQISLARQQAREEIERLQQELSEQKLETSRREQELADLGEQLRATRDEEASLRAASQQREELLRSDLAQAQEQSRNLAKDWEERLASRETSLQQHLESRGLEAASLRQSLANQEQSREQERAEFSAQRREWEAKLEVQGSELVRRQEELGGTAEQLASLQNVVQDTRQQFQQREAQHLAEQQRASEESTNLVNRLQGDIAALTEQLHQREAEAAAATERGSESALTLSIDLDNSRRELHELRLRHSQVELERASLTTRTQEQLADLTQRLAEREQELAGKEHELGELQKRGAHYCAEEQMLRQLEANLAAAAAAHEAERELCCAERLDLESRREELEIQRIALATQRGELEARQSDLAAQQSELESRLGKIEEPQHQLESASGELEAERGLLAAQRREMEHQNVALELERESLRAQQSELLSQAGLYQETTRRCEALETELAALRTNPPPQSPSSDFTATTVQDQAANQHEELVERWQSEAQKWQVQAEEVAGQLGEFKNSCARLKDEINELRAAGRQAGAEPPAEQPNLQVTLGAIDLPGNEIDATPAQLREEQTRIESLRTELSARELSLARLEADLKERQSAWEASRGEQAAALDERSQLITMQISQFEAEQAAYARQQANMIQQMSSLEDRVQELTSASESTAHESAEVDSGVSRLAEAGLWQGREGAGELAEGVLEQTGFEPARDIGSSQLSPPAAEHQDDDSIEQYMSRLLNRVRGDSPAASASQAPVWRSEVASPAQSIAAAPAPKNADQPKEYVPRVQAPELPGRLSQMRELANSAANSAIHTHARQHQSRMTKHKSLVALLSLIGAIALFIAGTTTGSYLALGGAALFMSVCCVMSMRAILGGFQQLCLRRPGPTAIAPAKACDSAPNAPAPAAESPNPPG